MNLGSRLFSLLMWSGKIKPNLALHSGQPILFLQIDFFCLVKLGLRLILYNLNVRVLKWTEMNISHEYKLCAFSWVISCSIHFECIYFLLLYIIM